MDFLICCTLVLAVAVTVTAAASGGGGGGGRTRPHFTHEPPARLVWAATRGAYAECRARGDPPPTLDWITADGLALTTIPGLRHVLSDGTLVLGARRSQLDAGGGGGVLRCRATNPAGVVLSRPVLLLPVEDAALAYSVRQLTAARVGRSVTLRCEASAPAAAPPHLHITWLQDGVPVPHYLSPESRWLAGAGGLLLGRELTASELQAEYACVVADAFTSPPYRLITDDGSFLDASLSGAAGAVGAGRQELPGVEARVGDTVVLPCLLDLATDSSVVWQHEEAGRAVRVGGAPDMRVRGSALVLSPARAHHAGLYSCSADGGPHSPHSPHAPPPPPARVSRSLLLALREPLTVTLEPNPLMVSTGGMGRFNCTVSGGGGGGGGGAAVTWQHEGRPLSHAHVPRAGLAPPAHHLDVGPVRAHHAGGYQCTAADHLDTAVAEAELVIADSPPRLVSTFAETLARAGQAVALRCAADGEPPPRILWTLDGRPLPSQPNRFSVSSAPGGAGGAVVSWLNVSVSGPEEGGRYACNATNARGFSSHYARLNVIGPPYIRFVPPIHVTADSDMTLYCPYSGYPIKEVVWVREDGSPAEGGSGAGIVERGELRLTGVRASSAGGYTCEVRADSGELARRTLHLLVHKPPKIAPLQFPDGVEVGGSAQATCSLLSGDKPIHFTWLKDDLPISPSMKVEQKNMDFFSILIIAEVTSAHSGTYTCRATNAVGSVSHSTDLLVKEAPAWRWRAQNTSVSAGATLLLPCAATGFPPPQLIWEYSTDRTSWRPAAWGVVAAAVAASAGADGGGGGGAVLADGTAWVRGAAAQHEGWYRCTARSPHHAPIHNVFYLDVNEPPRLSRVGGGGGGGGGGAAWAVRGTAARLACAARGEHALRLHWTHNHNAMPEQEGVTVRESVTADGLVSELVVARAEQQHAGEYRCHAHNLYGSAELAFTLLVKERPSAPRELRVAEAESRRVRVSWSRPRANVALYTLQYRAAEHERDVLDAWDRHVVNVTLAAADLLTDTEEGAATWLRALTPHTHYALRVAAANDVGVSPYSSPLHFTTRAEAPGAAPRDVVVRALRPRELHVSWQPPARETLHGTLIGFTVRWWETGESGGAGGAGEGAEINARGDAGAATLRGLHPATRYAVTVTAYNDVGAGPASPPLYHHTLESPPWGVPEGVSCAAGGATSLRVTWRPPPHDTQGGRLTHYTLQYVRREPAALLLAPHREAQLRAQGTEASVTRLTPHAQYEVRVRAHTAAGDGPFGAPLLCRTDEDVPSAPAGMKLVALGERSLRASWLPPTEPNGLITHYSLYVRDLAGSEEANVTRVSVEGGGGGDAESGGGGPAECMRALRGLRPGRTYEAWSRAATAVGEGPPSAAVACQPSGLAPARISSFGGAVVAAAGGAVSLRCVVGGAPPPAKRWLRAGAALQPRPPYYLDGDALSIRGLDTTHADNYTCVAENPHGSDSATWRVVVLRPPPPPALALAAARARELELELRAPPHLPGHAPARSYTLHWRPHAAERDVGAEWRSEPAAPGPLVLRGLRCGSLYLAYAATADGPASPEISARTAGGPPRGPPDARWIETNATAARLDAAAWEDGGCGAVSLRLEWAGAGAGGGAREVGGAEPVVLGGLLPGTWYRLAARATNEAGTTRALYDFATLTSSGARLADARDVSEPFPATAGESALLLALCAALSLAALTILLILLRRKRGVRRARAAAECTEKMAAPGGCGTYRPPLHTPAKLPPEPQDVYEISPYATFAGPPGGLGGPPGGLGGGGGGSASRAYTLQLRALSRHDDDAAPPPGAPACCDEETCLSACEAQRRRRRRHHHYYPDPDHGCSQDSGS